MNEEQKFIERYPELKNEIFGYPYLHYSLSGNALKKASDWFECDVEQKEAGEGEGEGVWRTDITRNQDFVDLFHFKGNGKIKLLCNRNLINEWTVDGELLVSPFKWGQTLPSYIIPYGLTSLESDSVFTVKYYRRVILENEKRIKEMRMAVRREDRVLGVNEKGETVVLHWGSLHTRPNELGIADLRELGHETGEN